MTVQGFQNTENTSPIDACNYNADCGAGRYAPTPSGMLHLGNLRTALWAAQSAAATGRHFRLRIEDLDTSRCDSTIAYHHIADLTALGITWDGPILWQSRRNNIYHNILNTLYERGLVYECYCSRREIHEAPRAPHTAPGSYPGTCRHLTSAQRARKRAELAAQPGNRQPALRLRATTTHWTIQEQCAIPGATLHTPLPYTGPVDDMVLRRGDGIWAYNFAVVIDDAAQGVDHVVRGADLLTSAPRQAYLAHILNLPIPQYCHVPLMTDLHGERLAKRHNNDEWTLAGVLSAGYIPGTTIAVHSPADVREWLLSFPPRERKR